MGWKMYIMCGKKHTGQKPVGSASLERLVLVRCPRYVSHTGVVLPPPPRLLICGGLPGLKQEVRVHVGSGAFYEIFGCVKNFKKILVYNFQHKKYVDICDGHKKILLRGSFKVFNGK